MPFFRPCCCRFSSKMVMLEVQFFPETVFFFDDVDVLSSEMMIFHKRRYFLRYPRNDAIQKYNIMDGK